MRFRLELGRVFEGSNSVTYSFTAPLFWLTVLDSEEGLGLDVDLAADLGIEKESFIASRILDENCNTDALVFLHAAAAIL